MKKIGRDDALLISRNMGLQILVTVRYYKVELLLHSSDIYYYDDHFTIKRSS